MLKKIEKIYDEKIIKWFYILLPIVELATTYMVMNMKTSITVGMVYKTLFLIYAVFYLIFINKKKRKVTFAFMGIVLSSVIINLLTTIDSFSISILVSKISELCKYVTFPITMLFFFRYVENGNKIYLKTLVYSATIYATVMLLARITGTQYPTYETIPEHGHSGWYYSGNEISALLAMFYPIIIYFTGKYKTKSMLFSLCVVTYGLLAIGTKTSFFSIAIIIGILLIFELVMFIVTKNKLSKDMLFTVFILLVVLFASAPYSPSLKYMQDRINVAESTVKNENVENKEENNNKIIVQAFVYNGRERDMKEQIEMYKDSSVIEKIFGLNNENRIKSNGNINMIERDLYDIFFAYGIFGTIVYFLPILYVGINFAKRLFTNFKEECNEKNFVIGISCCISLGISYIAGHVLLAPTVVLFFSVLLSKLNMEGDFFYIDNKAGKRKIAIFISRLSIGGMERALINLLKMSDLRNKYDIKLYVGYIKDNEYIDDIPDEIETHIFCTKKWILKNKIITILKMLLLKLNLIFKDNYYASICYGHHHGILASITRIASKNNIIFIHADLKNRTEVEINKLNRYMKFKKFKKVVCVSEKALESFKAIFPDYTGISTVINNYIDGQKIIDMSIEEKEIEEQINFDNKVTFVHVSRQEEKSKKISRIIESTKRLKEEKYDFQVLLIGEGEDTENYKKQIKEYGLEDTILMLGKKKNPYVYIKKSSALLFTSLYEGYGIVLDEARVLNVPVISTLVADAEKIVNEGYGILCENSQNGVYNGMKEFLNNSFVIKNTFDYEKFNNKITNKLNDIVKER